MTKLKEAIIMAAFSLVFTGMLIAFIVSPSFLLLDIYALLY